MIACQEICDYCDKEAAGRSALEEELEVCQEMVRLLPAKIENIRRRLK